jgi:glycosyltransferase involved in cell wall biosynthesis
MLGVSYLGTVSRAEVLRQTSLADCVVVPYDSSLYNNVIALPNKLFEALAMSKPLLVQKGTFVAQIVEDNNCGIATDFCDVEEIRKALTTIEEGGRSQLNKKGLKAKQLYQAKYSWDRIEDVFLQLYQQIVDAKRK